MKRLAHLAPLLGAAVFVLLFTAYYFSLPLTGDVGLEAESIAIEQGKILWGSASLLLNLSMLWSIIIGVEIVVLGMKRIRRKRGRWIALILGAGVLLGLAVTVWEVSGSGGKVLLEQVTVRVPAVHHILRINNVAAAVAIVTLLFAAYFIGHRAQACTANELSSRLRSFRLTLYSAAVLLGAGVYQIFRLYQWGALMHDLETKRAWILDYAHGLAIGGGIAFSSLLILIFLPPAILLNHSLDKLTSAAAQKRREFDREKWLIQQGLEVSPLYLFTGRADRRVLGGGIGRVRVASRCAAWARTCAGAGLSISLCSWPLTPSCLRRTLSFGSRSLR
jgi:hypothetical protein